MDCKHTSLFSMQPGSLADDFKARIFQDRVALLAYTISTNHPILRSIHPSLTNERTKSLLRKKDKSKKAYTSNRRICTYFCPLDPFSLLHSRGSSVVNCSSIFSSYFFYLPAPVLRSMHCGAALAVRSRVRVPGVVCF